MYRLVVAILTASVFGALAVAAQRNVAEEQPSELADTANEKESLEVQYARAYLQLAQTDLQIAHDANKKVRGTYPEASMDPLRQVVAIAKAQLKYAIDGRSGGLHGVHIRQAEAMVTEAENDWQRTEALHQKAAELVGPVELRRARLRLEVAKLDLALARDVNSGDPLQHMQWQLEELRKEVLELRSQLARISL